MGDTGKIGSFEAESADQSTATAEGELWQAELSRALLVISAADVLIYIFSLLPFRSRILCTHVCRPWRQLILDAPVLWADPQFDNYALRKATKRILARSKSSLINVHILQRALPYHGRDPAIKSLRAHAGRVRSLTICSPTASAPQSLIELDTAALPSLQRPTRYETTYLHIPTMLQLQRLHVDWDERGFLYLVDPRLPAHQQQPSGVLSLREAVILRGVQGVDFLAYCKHLRVLILRVPHLLAPTDALQIVMNNPGLTRLELVFPLTQRWDLEGTLGDWLAKPIDTHLERLLLGEYCLPEERHWHRLAIPPATYAHFLATRLNCLQIPDVEYGVQLDRGFLSTAFSQLQNVAVLDEYQPKTFRVLDSRGRMRCFSGGIAGGRFVLDSFQFLSFHLRALCLFVPEWQSLAALGSTTVAVVFDALEELHLKGSIVQIDGIRPTVLCPNLLLLTLSFYPKMWRPRGSQPSYYVDFATKFADGCGSRRLRQLNLLGFFGHTGWYTFGEPNPETVYAGLSAKFPQEDLLREKHIDWCTTPYAPKPSHQ